MKKRRSRLLALLMCLTMMLGTTSVVSAAEPTRIDLSEYKLTYVDPDKFGEMAYFDSVNPVYESGDILDLVSNEEYFKEWGSAPLVIPTREEVYFVDASDIIKSEGLDLVDASKTGGTPSSVLITGVSYLDTLKDTDSFAYNNEVYFNFDLFKNNLNELYADECMLNAGFDTEYTYAEVLDIYKEMYVYVFKSNGTYTLVKLVDVPKYSKKYNENDYTCKVDIAQEDGDTAKITVNWNFNGTGSVANDFRVTDEAGVVLKSESFSGATGNKEVLVDLESNGTIFYNFYTSHTVYTGSFDIDWYDNEDVVTPDDIVNPKISADVNSDNATVTVTSDIKAILTFGDEVTDEYVTSYTFDVPTSGTYTYSATTDKGGYSTSTVEVNLPEDGEGSTEEVPDPWEHWEEDEEDELAQTGLSKPVIITVSTIMLVISVCVLFFVRKRKVGDINEK